MANVGKVWNGTAWVDVGSTATFQSAGTATVGVVQLTDSTSSTSTTTAATPNSVKSAYDLANTANTTAGTAIPKNTVTAAGDILYASGSATVTSLAIGTAAQVLSVGTAGVPTWSNSGGMTCIGTATPNGATTLAFSSIPGTYKHLKIVYRDVYFSTTTSWLGFRLNGSTTAVYDWGGITNTSNTSNAASVGIRATQGANVFGDGDVRLSVVPGGASASGANSASGIIDIYRYTELEHRVITFEATAYDNVNSRLIFVQGNGRWRNTTDAITSVDFVRSSTQTITGTFYLYGVS